MLEELMSLIYLRHLAAFDKITMMEHLQDQSRVGWNEAGKAPIKIPVSDIVHNDSRWPIGDPDRRGYTDASVGVAHRSAYA